MTMRVATSFSVDPDSEEAARAAYEQVSASLGGTPTWIVVAPSVRHDVGVVRKVLAELAPGAAIHGSTSCLGVMTEAGFHAPDGVGLGLFAVIDPDGAFGVGAARAGDDSVAASSAATQAAIAAAGRTGEVPSLLWLSAAPGAEESVVRGIGAVVGDDVPVVGGSAADNTVSGEWKLFDAAHEYTDAVVVSALFPSSRVVSAFQSGYSPTSKTGRVTRAEGRRILEIDGRPAARVYDEWTDGAIHDALEAGGNILSKTTLHPLGRRVGVVGGAPYYRLAHPDSVTADGGLSLFADVQVGDTVVLMEGSVDGLVTRAGRVAHEAMDRASLDATNVAGALVVFCAGCMLTVKDDMETVVAGLREALPNKPFLGVFTFGEQGCMAGGENVHGNLMISATLLAAG